uniref:Uncharacterized protein n=1 Tax=Anguilla anguilla TaxID=7936 RepID=A0A0E9S2W5_ANGAN
MHHKLSYIAHQVVQKFLAMFAHRGGG